MTLEAKRIKYAEVIEKEMMRWHLLQKMVLQELSKYSRLPNQRQSLSQLILELNEIKARGMKLKFRQIKPHNVIYMKMFTMKLEKRNKRLGVNPKSIHQFKKGVDKKSRKLNRNQ